MDPEALSVSSEQLLTVIELKKANGNQRSLFRARGSSQICSLSQIRYTLKDCR